MNESIDMDSFQSPLRKNPNKLTAITVSRVHSSSPEVDSCYPINEYEASLIFACTSLLAGINEVSASNQMNYNLRYAYGSICMENPSLSSIFLMNQLNQYYDIRSKITATGENNREDQRDKHTVNCMQAFIKFLFQLKSLYNYKSIQHMANATKIVVFNEMFFSSIITPEYYTSNITQLMHNVFDAQTFVYLNFLYASDSDREGTVLDLSRYETYVMATRYVFCDDNIDNDRKIKADYINRVKLASWQNAHFGIDTMRVFNRGGFYSGCHRLSYYDKASYFKEGQDFMRQQYGRFFVYNHGDGKDHTSIQNNFSNLLAKEKNFVINNISTETCFDLVNGIRRTNQWINNDTTRENTKKIHIIASNYIEIFEHSDNLYPNLPNDRLIIHADPRVFNGGVFGVNKRKLGLYNVLYKAGVQPGNLSSILTVVNSPILSISLEINSKIFVFCLYDLVDSFNRFDKGY